MFNKSIFLVLASLYTFICLKVFLCKKKQIFRWIFLGIEEHLAKNRVCLTLFVGIRTLPKI